MKATGLLSIKQLAELLSVSTDTIRRVARKGLIPSSREGTAYRFDWRKVRGAMEARANERRSRRRSKASAPGGESRPRAQAIAPDW
jgi:excisionase family DNA binding protein